MWAGFKWFGIRLLVTAACIFTIKNLAHMQGYHIEYNMLIVSALCLIVGLKVWFPACNCQDSPCNRR